MYSLGLLNEYSIYLNCFVHFNENNKGQKLYIQPLGVCSNFREKHGCINTTGLYNRSMTAQIHYKKDVLMKKLVEMA